MAQCSSGTVPAPSITFVTASFWRENDFGDFYSGAVGSRVGIGTAVPATRLHVVGGLLADGPVGSVPVQGAGTRLMWVPNRAALRAGIVSGSHWNTDSVGWASVALGEDVAATDSHAVAMGQGVRATAPGSMAFGSGGRDSLGNSVSGVNNEPNSLAFFAGHDFPVMVISKKIGDPPVPPIRRRCDKWPYTRYNSDVEINGDLHLRRRNTPEEVPCGGNVCAEGSLWSRVAVRSHHELGFSDDCQTSSSFRFRLFRESNATHERVELILPSSTNREGPLDYRLMRFHHNMLASAHRTNDHGAPEVSIGHNFPQSTLPWRLRIGGATTSSNPVPKAILTDGGIQIERGGKAWSHNFVVALPTASQFERDLTKCFTVVNGASTETFNVLGSGDVLSEGSLRVKKDIHCNRLKVSLNPMTASFPDYVFAPDYRLMPLATLRQYVATECHLPGVPSAPEVEQAGSVDVGATQLKLIEKLEELTLYILQLDERVEHLEKENVQLKTQLGR